MPARAQALAAHVAGRRAPDRLAKRSSTRPDVDIVIVATTTTRSRRWRRRRSTPGKHVLVEKPAARTSPSSIADRGGGRAQRRLVRVGFNHRYHPALRKAREIVDSGALGR